MKRIFVVALSVLLAGSWFCSPAAAGVNVDIHVSVPPPIRLPAPPLLIPIPGTYVYGAPDVDVDIIFYQGYWYRPHRGRWYRSHEYNGRWVLMPPRRVPAGVTKLPPNWKRTRHGRERIPYGQVKKNWRTWERDRHWDKREKRHERRDKRRGHRREEDRGRRGRDRHHD